MAGGFGTGIADFESALEKGETPSSVLEMETFAGPVCVPALIADTGLLKSYINKRDLRRIDHYTRMALLGCYLALEDAGSLVVEPERTGIIVATGYGATCNTFDFRLSILDDDEGAGSPTKFANSVHNVAAGSISMFLKIQGPSLSVSHFDMSVPSALLSACHWLSEGWADTVLLGFVDEYCKVLGYYWNTLYGLNAETPVSFQHAVIGEGSVFFVLRRANDQKRDNGYGFIEKVQTGITRRSPVKMPPESVMFFPADGYSECREKYAEMVDAKGEVASYTRLYGGLPVGMGFEIAVACLSRKYNRFFPSPSPFFNKRPGWRLIDGSETLEGRPIACLKLGSDNEFGMAVLTGDREESDFG
jgi:3-oxoacyl-[acyl-carrier-protein] synthase II